MSTSVDMALPWLIQGGLAVDDRGSVSFVNDFGFGDVRRFYVITNHQAGFVRAWHGHRREGKYITVVSGSAVVAAVKVDDWDTPSVDSHVHRHVLSAERPAVLAIPPGYANGSMSLTADTRILVFSTSSLDEGRDDDVRFPARLWDVWTVEER
jgi:dTDP-4-dehydrorhamnose 3,5-epimerase-like enzyme